MASFFSKFDSDRIVQAIAAAEAKSSAEIRVHVTRRVPKDLEQTALERFQKLEMTHTAERNGVLVYIAPRARLFRIVGDVAIHQKCGDQFWKDVASAMESRFRNGEFTEGVVVGVQLLGDALAQHFPRLDTDKDELSNAIDEE